MQIRVRHYKSTGVFKLVNVHPMLGELDAGPRLLRLHPPMGLRFRHDNMESAMKDAARLQAHIDSSPSLKGKGKLKGGFVD